MVGTRSTMRGSRALTIARMWAGNTGDSVPVGMTSWIWFLAESTNGIGIPYGRSWYSTKLPALAVIAELAISEAKRAITLPLADGRMMPSTTATLLAAIEEALLAAGRL